jgi:uncharacterized phage-associated protein
MILRRNRPTPFMFDQEKAIQAVAFLLKQKPDTNRSDNYMRILKLLYFADRESIRETGLPITGDSFVALPHGPTLSRMCDLVRQKAPGGIEWDKYIERDGYDIRLINDPGNGKLCRYEIELLERIWDENRELGEWEVAVKSKQLPEFLKNNPGTSSRFIPFADLLEAIGRSDWLQDILDTSKNSFSPV